MNFWQQEYFHMPLGDWIIVGVFLAVFILLLLKNKLPSVDGLKEVVDILNSRGGNILILAYASIYFFNKAFASMQLMMQMVAAGTLKPDNVFAHTTSQFLTSVAFGGAFGALLKTMTGEPNQKNGNGGGSPPPSPLPALNAATHPILAVAAKDIKAGGEHEQQAPASGV